MATTLAVSRRHGAARRIGRRAFTLIEVLVVVCIIGLLMGLLLPAVQAAREAGRRLQCVANLRQIGVAMHAYNAVHDMFPPGEMINRRGVGDNQLSELLFLLPHLEQSPLFNSFNMAWATVESGSTPTVDNRTSRNTRLASFLCPGDGEPDHLNSYRFNRGKRSPAKGRLYDGPFSFGVLPSQASVTDGLTNTAFVSERIAGSFTPGGVSLPRDIQSSSPSFAVSDDQTILDCQANPPTFWFKPAGRYWHLGGFAFGHYNHNATPNDPRPSCMVVDSFGKDGGGGLSPPRSYHPGGVNVLYGDAHVQFVANGIDARVWAALGTHDSGD